MTLNANQILSRWIEDGETTPEVIIATASGEIAPTHSVVNVTTVTGAALAANPDRTYALLVNDSDTDIYIALGVAAVAHEGILISALGDAYPMSAQIGNLYLGVINAIHAGSGNKVLMITEGEESV